MLEAGVRVLIYTGDSDWTCSWIANSGEANSVRWPGHQEFQRKSLKPYTVNGKERGSFKTIHNLSYMKVYDAGHDLAYFRKFLLDQFTVRFPQFITVNMI